LPFEYSDPGERTLIRLAKDAPLKNLRKRDSAARVEPVLPFPTAEKEKRHDNASHENANGIPVSDASEHSDWASTGFAALALGATGAADLLRVPPIMESLAHLGYPRISPPFLVRGTYSARRRSLRLVCRA
jgi:hypothetical protein